MILLQIDTVTGQATGWITTAKEIAMQYDPNLIKAILVYIIGSWIIKKIGQLLNKVFIKRNYDPSLRTFLSSPIKISLSILLLFSVFEMIGIKINAFAALLAGSGLAIGAAPNGSLGNFAGGVMMLVFKPSKVGDMIEAQGQTGVVTEQGIFIPPCFLPIIKPLSCPTVHYLPELLRTIRHTAI